MSKKSSPKAHSRQSRMRNAALAPLGHLARKWSLLSHFRLPTHTPNQRNLSDEWRRRKFINNHFETRVSSYNGVSWKSKDIFASQQRDRRPLLHSLVCNARKVRRAVLFAHKRAGGGHRKPHWSPFSHIRC